MAGWENALSSFATKASPVLGAVGLALNVASMLGLGGKKKSLPTYAPTVQDDVLRQQMELMRAQQERLTNVDIANQQRWQQLFPVLQAITSSALRGLGFTAAGEDTGLQRMAWLGAALRQAQQSAAATKAKLTAMGLNPAQADLLTRGMVEDVYLNALPQTEQQNQQRLLQGVGLVQNLLGSSAYQPVGAPAVMQTAASMVPALLGAQQNAWQMQQQYALQQQQQKQQNLQQIGTILGILSQMKKQG